MSEKKINVLVIPSDTFGVGHYRSVSPHTHLDRLYGDDFEIEIKYNVDYTNLPFFDKYDIVDHHIKSYNDFVENRIQNIIDITAVRIKNLEIHR